MVISLRDGRSRNRGSIPGRRIKIFSVLQSDQTGPCFQPASYSLDNDYFLRRVKAVGGVNPTTPLHLCPSLRMCGTIPLLPHLPAWRGQGQIYLWHTYAKIPFYQQIYSLLNK